ncbi:hypothetical protein AVEN_25575-1 [Araneus ventricosus]|uniref:Uncharacterized protein n=1 Tax=Araneus ventricosus TaxID=182803 RepID=A0A4Y2BU82_ARAVE|nr:hypothetical protein AVEN_25575-1 [Araneus ventricosus]
MPCGNFRGSCHTYVKQFRTLPEMPNALPVFVCLHFRFQCLHISTDKPEYICRPPFLGTGLVVSDFFFLITGHLAPGPGDESIVRIVLRAREMFSYYFFFIYTLSRTSMLPSGGSPKCARQFR